MTHAITWDTTLPPPPVRESTGTWAVLARDIPDNASVLFPDRRAAGSFLQAVRLQKRSSRISLRNADAHGETGCRVWVVPRKVALGGGA